MKIIIFGLGSMGRRRIRCLQSLGYSEITGYDINFSRALEVQELTNIELLDDTFDLQGFELALICTPPDIHEEYIKICLNQKIPMFVEASVLNENLFDLNARSKSNKIPIIPSSTMRYHPAIKIIKNMIVTRQYGQLRQGMYHSGNYLPDWHLYENVSDFYVSKKKTGGAREIVPFELTWIVDCIGVPEKIIGNARKIINIPGAEEIDDAYNLILEYPFCNFMLSVDVISRPADRSLLLVLDRAIITWNWEDDFLTVKKPSLETERLQFAIAPAHDEYNPNITEQMYIEELEAVINYLNSDNEAPYNLDQDISVLSLLYDLEQFYENTHYN